jgi:hypothetical protein
MNASPWAGLMLALLAVTLPATDGLAQKEQFQRTKPHVNVGTIGDTQTQTGNLTGQPACPPPSSALPAVQAPQGDTRCVPPNPADGAQPARGQ